MPTDPEQAAFTPEDPGFAERVRGSFARQGLMATLNAELVEVGPGRVVIEMPSTEAAGQQHGYVHAGAIASIADSACGYACLTLMPAGGGVLSAEFKINLMRPAAGDRFRAVGRVVRLGRTLGIATGEVWDITGEPKQIALMQNTLVRMEDRAEVVD